MILEVESIVADITSISQTHPETTLNGDEGLDIWAGAEETIIKYQLATILIIGNHRFKAFVNASNFWDNVEVVLSTNDNDRSQLVELIKIFGVINGPTREKNMSWQVSECGDLSGIDDHSLRISLSRSAIDTTETGEKKSKNKKIDEQSKPVPERFAIFAKALYEVSQHNLSLKPA